ncbi:hypothetical protein HanXRQr2_Chr16g0765151 [Helianthus annuus]|uniref:Uncharacterized protein n=1 Tax=Helianthus annuus TaxID=4232 RepID=A0A9K3H002_HELAN|nr:hypothetical protein HanXRQr2_Chr16g0765151 [Helianthus annuus]KAJ0822543.1 hypothetical protein HanPSC8_Chr16g0733311 [Helianthus annuus]
MLYENGESSPRECLCIARERMGQAQTNLCKQDQRVLLLRHNLKNVTKFVNPCICEFTSNES